MNELFETEGLLMQRTLFWIVNLEEQQQMYS